MPASGNEVLKYCPKCEYAEFIEIGSQRFNCMQCGCKICPSCNSEPPHIGISCKENRNKAVSPEIAV